MAEVLNRFRPKIDASDVMDRLGLERDGFFVVSAHREENVDSPLKLRSLTESLQRLAAEFGFPVIVSTHPRTRKRLGAQPDHALSPLVRFLPPFGFPDYVKLQLGAYCVISDGGTITEEAALLDIPAVTVRDAHERPEGMDAGVLVRSSLTFDGLSDAVRIVRAGLEGRRFSGEVKDYTGGLNASSKVVRIVASYIDVGRWGAPRSWR